MRNPRVGAAGHAPSGRRPSSWLSELVGDKGINPARTSDLLGLDPLDPGRQLAAVKQNRPHAHSSCPFDKDWAAQLSRRSPPAVNPSTTGHQSGRTSASIVTARRMKRSASPNSLKCPRASSLRTPLKPEESNQEGHDIPDVGRWGMGSQNVPNEADGVVHQYVVTAREGVQLCTVPDEVPCGETLKFGGLVKVVDKYESGSRIWLALDLKNGERRWCRQYNGKKVLAEVSIVDFDEDCRQEFVVHPHCPGFDCMEHLVPSERGLQGRLVAGAQVKILKEAFVLLPWEPYATSSNSLCAGKTTETNFPWTRLLFLHDLTGGFRGWAPGLWMSKDEQPTVVTMHMRSFAETAGSQRFLSVANNTCPMFRHPGFGNKVQTPLKHHDFLKVVSEALVGDVTFWRVAIQCEVGESTAWIPQYDRAGKKMISIGQLDVHEATYRVTNPKGVLCRETPGATTESDTVIKRREDVCSSYRLVFEDGRDYIQIAAPTKGWIAFYGPSGQPRLECRDRNRALVSPRLPPRHFDPAARQQAIERFAVVLQTGLPAYSEAFGARVSNPTLKKNSSSSFRRVLEIADNGSQTFCKLAAGLWAPERDLRGCQWLFLGRKGPHRSTYKVIGNRPIPLVHVPADVGNLCGGLFKKEELTTDELFDTGTEIWLHVVHPSVGWVMYSETEIAEGQSKNAPQRWQMTAGCRKNSQESAVRHRRITTSKEPSQIRRGIA